MSYIYTVMGNITDVVTADAIIAVINPRGEWVGAIDRAIRAAAGPQFHRQAESIRLTTGLKNGQIIIAKGDDTPRRFLDVVFIVDDNISPLNELVYAGLMAAEKAGYQTVSLPTMRTGVMQGLVEPSLRATLNQMILGIRRFMELQANMRINVVVYEDFVSYNYLVQNM